MNLRPKGVRLKLLSIQIAAAALVGGCASVRVSDDMLRSAFASCYKTAKLSMVGSCAEAAISQKEPNWTQHPRARYMSALFSYVNRAGEKVQAREWDRERYRAEITSFLNRLKIRMAQDDRAASSQAVEGFVRGLNSGITCMSITPGVTHCR